MTKFKVGDRVRLTGEAWEKHGMREEVYSVKRIVGGVPHVAVDNGRHMGIYRDGMDYSATLVEPAPPPADTSKRLREYTDLAHDDAVVIAGVEMKVSTRIGNGELCLWRNGHNHPITDPLFADMLVDEVRRKPRTKKRLVFDEVICDDDSTKTETRDMARNIGGAMWFVGSGELAGQQAFEDTDAHRLECALSQMREVEEANQRLAAQVTALTEERGISSELIENMKRHVDQLLARADRAEKERDEALEWRRRVADALDCIKDNGTIGDAEYVSGHAFKVRKFAEERDKWHAIYGETAEERDRAIAERDEAREAWGRAESDACEWEEKAGVASADLATFTEKLHKAEQERDDLGCQLEALRAVQRDDVADLRTRMEAVERHIVRLFGEEVPDEVHEHGWQWRPSSSPGTAFAPPFGTIRTCLACGCLVAGGPTRCVRCADDEKGGA